MKTLLSFALSALPIVACTTETIYRTVPPEVSGPETSPSEDETDEAATTSGTIGAEGGTVEGDGVVLQIPKGALTEETAIKIVKTNEPPPARHAGVTTLFKIEPDGLKLAGKKPAKITFTSVPSDTVLPVVGVKKEDGVFEGLATTVADGAVTASLTTLTDVFVAASDCKEADGTAKAALCKPTPAPATLKGQRIGAFALTGFEYWQWKKPDPYKGGDEVAWGYNGDGVPKTGVMPTEASRACMAESYATLEAILKNGPPQELVELEAKHGVHQFWFWNNDMTDAKPSVKPSKQNSELWLFMGDRGDGGLIKWISSTERDGTCKLPTRADLVTFAKACQTAFPKCGSGK